MVIILQKLYDDPENYLLLNKHRDDVGDIWRIIHKYRDLSFRVDKDAFLEILKKKRKGSYLVIKIDKDYVPKEIERREIFGVTFEQKRNTAIFISIRTFSGICFHNSCFSERFRPFYTIIK